MLFPKRQDILAAKPFLLGQGVSFGITRDFFLDSLFVEVQFTLTTQSATVAADGILGILKRMQLTIADGASNRLQTNVSGVSAIQKGFMTTGAMDQSTLNSFLEGNDAGSAGKTFRIRYPLYFRHPQLSDPVGCAFLLPIPRFNSNPVLELQFSTQADMDTNAAKTFAISAGTVRVIVNKRQVSDINLPTKQTEFMEAVKPFPASVSADTFELQVPGSYFGIGMRGYTSATAWGDIQPADGNQILQLLGTTLRKSKFSDIAMENQLSTQDNWSAITDPNAKFGLFPGLAYYDFLHDGIGMEVGELGSVLNTNILAGSGSRLQLIQDVTGGTNVQMAYFYDRVFGDLEDLKINLNRK